MKAYCFMLILLVCAAAGCKVDPNVQLLERELASQESLIYQLRDSIARHREKVDSCQRANSTLLKELKETRTDAGLSPDLTAPYTVSEPGYSPSTPPDETPGTQAPLLRSPSIMLPEEPGSPDDLPRSILQPHPGGALPDPGDLPDLPPLPGLDDQPPPLLPGLDAPTGEPTAPADSNTVSAISLNRMLTGGNNTDGRHGDEGIMVVIEPRDAEGRLVPAAASISVVVIDPELPAEDARIARWDFTAAETARMFRKTLFSEGLQLEMAWPGEPPSHEDLHLFVRYTTAAGTRLEASRTVTVDLPTRHAARWSPAARSASAPPSRPAPALIARRVDPPRDATPAIRQRPAWSPDRGGR
ncbi:MAG: hypothetical protein HQ581_06105 [Planctomycetes bacterium]|nr:hypothetical protein [Planctomycetota bacterium]